MKKSLLILIMITIVMFVVIQPSHAQYIIKEADAQYELYNYIKAIDLYEQAYLKKPSLHAAVRLANCYQLTHNYKETESWAAIAAGMENGKPENILFYAKALQNNSKYSEAKIHYEKYAALNQKVTSAQKSTWLLSCDSAIHWMKTPGNMLIFNQKELNTPQSDWGATLSAGDIIFASDRNIKADGAGSAVSKPFLKFDGLKKPDENIYGWTGNHYLRIYKKAQTGTQISTFPIDAGTDYHVGPATFTADGNEMYFTLTRIPEKPKFVKGKPATVNIEIYSSKKNCNGHWSTPVPFPYNRVNEYSVGDPFISNDGKTLYFASNLPGGSGGTDLYVSLKTENGAWGLPTNLKEINTPGNERCPFFDADNNFYFSSDGLIGMGGLDIFKAVLVAGKMGRPVNMRYPINSPQDDFAFNLTSEHTGFLSSNRPEGLGDDDIYSFKGQKPIIFKLIGTAYNKATGEPLANAIIALTKTDSGTIIAETEADGNYKFNLDKNADYNLDGSKTGYRSDKAKVSTQYLINSAEIKQELFLEPIVANQAIVLKNIYYNFNKPDSKPNSIKELDKVVKIMLDNPTIWIELSSHTDSRGSQKYNQWLSQSRANLVVKYIINKGINKNRIVAMGYGESKLVNKCKDGVACSVQEHQANRRTEFKIVKY